MLEYLEEGEDEAEISGRVLVERFAEKSRDEEETKKILIKKIAAGKDIVLEHPADVFYRVSDKNARSFQECWEVAKKYEHKKFFPPGRSPLMEMLELSRTRRHFVRALDLLETYENQVRFRDHFLDIFKISFIF